MTSFNREKAAPLAIAVSASVLAAVTAAAFLVGSSSVSLGDLVASERAFEQLVELKLLFLKSSH